MKAVVYKKSENHRLTLMEVGMPFINDKEVLVKVHAATVTPSDIVGMGGFKIMRLFSGSVKPNEPIPGVEFSGEITKVGKDVRRFKVGDQVFGSSLGFGAWAEYIRIPEAGTLTHKPINMDAAGSVGLCDGGITALLFLRDHAHISKGKRILINGASGSVGSYAIQLARHYGAFITGVCSTANMEFVKSLGADMVIDYTKEDFIRSGQTFDIIFDAVGKSSFSLCRNILSQNGLYLTTVPSLDVVFRKLFASKSRGKHADFAATGLQKADVRTKALDILRELAEAGELVSHVDRKYPLALISEAIAYVSKGHKIGNVVVSP